MRAELVVFGSVNVDLVCRVAALPRAGETVPGGDILVSLGGKGANQAVAAARAGARVSMRGAIGEQAFGLDLRAEMARYGVEMGAVAASPGPSGAALIAVDAQGENQIVVSPGANARVGGFGAPAPGATLLAQLELAPALVHAAFAAQKAAGGRTILNAAPAIRVPDGLFGLADVLIVNETELAAYAGDGPPEEAARRLHAPGQALIVTLGSAGALALTGEGARRVPAFPAKAVDATGAGDCFCGALAARLAGGETLEAALRFAAAAASISVERPGAAPSMPALDEVEARLASAR